MQRCSKSTSLTELLKNYGAKGSDALPKAQLLKDEVSWMNWRWVWIHKTKHQSIFMSGLFFRCFVKLMAKAWLVAWLEAAAGYEMSVSPEVVVVSGYWVD